MLIREAGAGDLPGILTIYNDAVRNTLAIWNETEVDLDNRRAWLADHVRLGYPVLVAVEDAKDAAQAEQVLGYATFGDWRAWEGYRYTVEHSVYIHRDARGHGLGAALMRPLIERAAAIGKHVMVAGIEASNEASLRLHERLGFQRVGHLPEVGIKFGRWLDLAFLQLMLASDKKA